MIKKTLLSLGVFLFGFIGFSYGWQSTPLNTNITDPVSNKNTIAVANKGNLITSFVGVGKNLLYFGPGSYGSVVFFWDTQGDGYFYTYYTNGSAQGVPANMTFCDSFGSDYNSAPANCTSSAYDKTFVKSFLSNLSSSDYWTYNYNLYFSQGVLAVCFSSESLNQSLCLCGGNGNNSFGGINCRLQNNTSKGYNRGLTFTDFPTEDVGYSPSAGGGGNNGGGAGTTVNGGNTYLCPTVGQLLSTYGSDYNTGLCYSSSLIMQNGSITTVEPQSIFELFENQSDFINYRQLYANYCSNSVSVGTDCQNAFAGKDIEYTLIAKIPGNIPSLNLYSYCNLALNQDPNTSTCVASGVYNTGVSREDVINSIIDGDYQVIVPSSGSITSEVIGDGTYFDGDIFSAIEGIYTKFTDFFTTQTGNSAGILPRYIISMLLVIILFRLFKK